ncbi:MAG: hypothetical protein WC246_02755 [Candidatus Paceibacterota bacterium]
MMPFERRRAMGKDQRLSHFLLDEGFYSVLGTTESYNGECVIVSRRAHFTYDLNNAVLVVYDEEGRPWIRAERHGGTNIIAVLVREYPCLKRGAYVPHSNDGGTYAFVVFPSL